MAKKTNKAEASFHGCKEVLSDKKAKRDDGRTISKEEEEKAFEPENEDPQKDASNPCLNCEKMQIEKLILDIKMSDLEKRIKQYPRVTRRGLQIGDLKQLAKSLHEEYNQISTNCMAKIETLESRIRETKLDVEQWKKKLFDIKERISILKLSLKIESSKNSKLEKTVKEIEAGFLARLDTQKKNIENFTESNSLVKRDVCAAMKTKLLLQKAEVRRLNTQNSKLSEYLEKVENVKKTSADRNENIFYRLMETRLRKVVSTIRNEARNSNFTWIREESLVRIADKFEIVVETILEKEPSLAYFINRLKAYDEQEMKKIQKDDAAQVLRSDVKKMLQEFLKTQKSKNDAEILKCYNYLYTVEKKIERKLQKRVEELDHLIVLVENYQACPNILKLQKYIDYTDKKLVTFFKEMKQFVKLETDIKRRSLRRRLGSTAHDDDDSDFLQKENEVPNRSSHRKREEDNAS
ncbi:unnamed protein product [Thelazia callipaeda]|uniref:DUF4201 domain-containing protein n=1 Tax=Thelazia callipaeda TaxID=103827 RepID=A0A0N5CVI2_THECL|nr:unnamed protein product [Thelazia callipaeda]